VHDVLPGDSWARIDVGRLMTLHGIRPISKAMLRILSPALHDAYCP